ncbi:hypothetical protein [Streptomyces sp. HNM0574]|uniref:peptidoglycan binding domain-containing protein n=1 Tax=Streptomyces sp. HNM0574 TaxID=2714954 RepID=UPI00146E55A1|nr:hypothetical protein [Streptomyces sp. HNM0574]NLU67318.1 hypothetical protein [Streptomyces sp. HNM0574]
MSRETDSSSSGPNGRGGSSYPPGTEPYGPSGTAGEPTGQSGSPGPGGDTDNSAEERKTETTLTTRIRINIPGSRPIPPVVMRTPMGEPEALPSSDREQDRPEDGTTAAGPATDPGPPTSNGVPAPTGAPASNGVPTPTGAPASNGAPAVPGPAAPREPEGAAAPGEGPQSGEFTQETSDWFAPRKSSGPSAGPGAEPTGPQTPDTSGPGPLAAPGLADFDAPGAGLADFDAPAPSGSAGPSGATTGPAMGDMPLPGHPGADDEPAAPAPFGAGGDGHREPITPGAAAGRPAGFPAPGTPATSTDPGAPAGPGAPGGLGGPKGPDGATGPLGGPGGPKGPDVSGPPAGLGASAGLGAPGGIGSPPTRSGPVGPSSGDDRIAGDTLVSGIPRVPSTEAAPSAAGAGAGESVARDEQEREPEGPAASGSGGGRSKLMLVGAGLVGVLGVAYGTGLLLDHADVPSGTTVLGVDIGGTSKHQAVNKLDGALGKSTTQAFTVVVNGEKAQLKPSVAGLTLDTEATVRDAAGRDYNPVTVIGSLFGASREAEPAIKIDDEKMASALAAVTQQTGGTGEPQDGMVKFVDGKAVGVPGKPHKGVDPEKSGAALEQALRERAVTGKNTPVTLPVTMQQPTVGEQEINRAIEEFGRPAMSGLVTVKAGDASIQFSPEKSLPKFLSMKAVNGSLVDSYDLQALEQLYGTTFDGVRITRGNGTKTPVMPQDVVVALREALKETDPAKRVQEIPVNGQ